jgi:hypothetical protein
MDSPAMHSDMEHDSGADDAKAPAMGVLHLSADMLPKGMNLNKGDVVEFKVIGDQDEEGEWPIEYNTGKEDGAEGKGGKEGEDGSWESDFRKAMSPRAEGEDGAMGGNSNGGGY